MRRLIFAAALAAGLSFAASSPALGATRNYDCTKPGNANKAACKQAAAKPAPAATSTKTTTASTTTKTTTRNYDCTKPGNANKGACKTAATQTPGGKSPGAVKTTTATKATTTDCTKWYNKARATCRTNSASTPAKTTVAPAPKPPVAATRASAPANDNKSAAGATAQCKDGTYSHSKTHQGACSHHGGVAKWL